MSKIIDWPEQIGKLVEDFIAVIPNVIAAIFLLIVGWILANILARIVKKVMTTIKVDEAADKLHEIDIVHKSNIKIVPSKIFSKLMYYVVIFIFLIASANQLGMEPVSDLISNLVSYIPKLISAAIVLAIGLWIADKIKSVVKDSCAALGVPAAPVISSLVFYFLFINILLLALKQAEINTDFLTTNISLILGGIIFAFAIGYGIASKDTMANLLGGLYSKNKFEIGEEIRIGEVRGKIVAKDKSSLTVKTNDSNVIVPLGQLTTNFVEKFNSK